jgi:DNA-binding LytR/AlgR family response regulator
MEKTNQIWVQTYVYKKRITIDTILFCRTIDHKTMIYLTPDGKHEKVSHSLTELENMLPADRFFRCNRQCIVNLNQVESYSEKIPEVVLYSGEKIAVAREREEELFRLLEAC